MEWRGFPFCPTSVTLIWLAAPVNKGYPVYFLWLKCIWINRAIADFDKAPAIDPEFGLVYYNRGNTWRAKGDLDAARSDYRQALKLNPALAATYYNRGKLRLDKGAMDRAIADFRKALKIDPEFTTAYRTLSRLLKSKSQQPIGGNIKALEFKKERPKK